MARQGVPQQVAADLRRRILSGELAEGAALGRYEDLLVHFEVSMPTLREAMKILEAEGLLAVTRGIGGGAVVRTPQSEGLAYPLGLVLEAGNVELTDLAAALQQVEPLCAGLCASRPDRLDAVVPGLRAIHQQALDSEDSGDFTHVARRFHEVIVESCGNETLQVLIGALVSLWSAHESEWAHQGGPGAPTVEDRREGLRAHGRLIDLIESGRVEEATKLAQHHADESLQSAVRRTTSLSVKADGLDGRNRRSGPNPSSTM